MRRHSPHHHTPLLYDSCVRDSCAASNGGMRHSHTSTRTRRKSRGSCTLPACSCRCEKRAAFKSDGCARLLSYFVSRLVPPQHQQQKNPISVIEHNGATVESHMGHWEAWVRATPMPPPPNPHTLTILLHHPCLFYDEYSGNIIRCCMYALRHIYLHVHPLA